MSNPIPFLLVMCAVLGTSLPAQDNASSARAADATAAKKAPPANLVVGVVDLDKAMEQYPKFIAGQKTLRLANNNYDEQMQQQTKRIDELKASVQLLREGTKERELKRIELDQAMQLRSNLAKVYDADLQLENMRLQIECYQDLETALAQIAKDRGVHLVLRLDGEPRPKSDEPLNSNQIQRRMLTFERRKVWFAADELDLTAALIKATAVPLDPAQDAPKDPPKGETPPAPNKDGK